MAGVSDLMQARKALILRFLSSTALPNHSLFSTAQLLEAFPEVVSEHTGSSPQPPLPCNTPAKGCPESYKGSEPSRDLTVLPRMECSSTILAHYNLRLPETETRSVAQLDCSGAIMAHYSLKLPGSSDPAISANHVTGPTATCHCIRLIFKFYVAQAGFMESPCVSLSKYEHSSLQPMAGLKRSTRLNLPSSWDYRCTVPHPAHFNLFPFITVAISCTQWLTPVIPPLCEAEAVPCILHDTSYHKDGKTQDCEQVKFQWQKQDAPPENSKDAVSGIKTILQEEPPSENRLTITYLQQTISLSKTPAEPAGQKAASPGHYPPGRTQQPAATHFVAPPLPSSLSEDDDVEEPGK
ncbi:hypothetical protein AAY473_023430 [Plecturocebus cupreus]